MHLFLNNDFPTCFYGEVVFWRHGMIETSDVELSDLPDDIDRDIVAFVDMWYEAHAEMAGGEVPTRKVLSADRLSKWRDDICIYEYLPVREDFLVRIDAPSVVAINGESFQNGTPREIDLKFGTCLMAALLKTLRQKRPTFHYVRVVSEGGQPRQWLRVLLPVQTLDRRGNPIDQVLGVRFAYEPVHCI